MRAVEIRQLAQGHCCTMEQYQLGLLDCVFHVPLKTLQRFQ